MSGPTLTVVRALLSRWVTSGHLLFTVSITLPLLLFVGAAWYDRTNEVARAKERIADTTNALAEHAEAVMETIELVLARVEDGIDQRDWNSIQADPSVHQYLVRLKQNLPQVESIFLIDPNGQLAATSRMFPAPTFDGSDREYYTQTKARGGLVISAPFRGQAAGTMAFTLSRPLLKDGKFNGVAAVTVYPAYFEGFYRAVVQNPARAAANLVRRNDGTVLVSYPELDAQHARLSADNPLIRAAEGVDRGVVMRPSIVSGDMRIAGFSHLERFPLLVSHSVDYESVLANSNKHLIVLAAFAVMIALCLLIASHLTLKNTQRDRENLQRLLLETDRRREAESRLQQSQKMEALGRLTGGVAHDFNNLLAAILGGIQLATKRVSDQRAIGFLTTAADAAKRGAKLTEQMLAFSRKQDIVLHRFNANALLTDMNDLLRRTTGGLIRIRYDLDQALWPIEADPVQLEVAILNLTVNARDAMPLGGNLVIATQNIVAGTDDGAPALPPGEYVRVSVTDNGEGMKDDVKSKAFEPFFTTKGPGKGTGLGLSTVFGFATQLGGTVTINSTIGRGTTVAILIPRSAGDVAIQDKAPPTMQGPQMPNNILLVDDDQAVRELTAEMLEDLGHAVTTAVSGRDALTLLAEDKAPFDILMTDFAMPEMNGATLATEAQKIRPALAILFMTGYAEVGTLDGWAQSGARTIAKPFTYEELGAALQSVAPVAKAAGTNVVSLRR